MDQILINIFNNTNLSNNFKNGIFNVLNKYQDKMYGYISVGDAYLIATSLAELEKDLINIKLDQKTIDAFVYASIKYYCDKEKDNIIVWKEMYERLFKDTLLNTINRVQILNIENPKTELVKYLKEAAVLTAELLDLMSLEKPYLVLKKYREIMNLCLYQGLDPSLLKNEEELKNRLEKKYSYYSKMRNPFEYRKIISQRKITLEDNFKADNFICFETPDCESYVIQYVMHLLMKEYYKKTGYFLRPLTRDIFLYYLKDITIVAYLYDDVPKMSLKSGRLYYNWDDPHFWAEVYNPKMDYIISDNFNYFIDDIDNPHIFKVVPLNFEKTFYKGLGKKVIFTPEKDIDEALFKFLNHTNDIKLLEQLELNSPESNNLMTSNNLFYFKDPTKIDMLEVENLEEHHYFNLIKSKINEASRKKTIAYITAYSKKHPKKVEKTFQKKFTKNFTPEIRLPYKDN
ncbi:MAG: hypothetical protein PHG03_06005 [Bacilli bacterium]|nr:hypothetical protein [Bacilli bacterium]MDD4796083.1 hypothetical protein [Bacilli bacterium]